MGGRFFERLRDFQDVYKRQLQAFLIASLPYLLKDVVSVVAAYGAARAILFSLKKAKLGNAL